MFTRLNVTIPAERTQSPRPIGRLRAHRSHPRRGLAAAALLALALALPAAAQAESISPGNSGGDQYVPPVPDAGGNRPSNPGNGDPGKLPPSVRHSLPAGSEGKILARLATDPGSGAPSVAGVGGSAAASGSSGSGGGGSGDNGSGGGGAGAGGDNGGGGGDSAGEANTTAASAITSSVSDNPGVGIVAAAMLALMLAAAAFGRAQRRRRRRI